MKASLLYFILDIAAVVLPHVAQHLAEHPFQRVVCHGAAWLLVGVAHRCVAIVADVKRGAVKVAGVYRCIMVATAQFIYVLASAKHTGNDEFVQWHLFNLQTVEEVLTDMVEQYGRAGHEIWRLFFSLSTV